MTLLFIFRLADQKVIRHLAMNNFPRVHNKPAESPRRSGLELFLELNRGINLCAFRWGAHADVVGRIAECAS
jgi:hypothetical protein